MSKKRTFLFRAATLLVLLVTAAVMFIVGRGHTVYFDNKTFEYEGVSYPAAYKAEILDGDKEIATLFKRERGMATWIGQNFRMTLLITKDKGGEAVSQPLELKLPYSVDNIVLNLPALLAGLPEAAYLQVFIPQESQTEVVEEIVTDELVPADI